MQPCDWINYHWIGTMSDDDCLCDAAATHSILVTFKYNCSPHEGTIHDQVFWFCLPHWEAFQIDPDSQLPTGVDRWIKWQL
jgi:hypothetical protein